MRKESRREGEGEEREREKGSSRKSQMRRRERTRGRTTCDGECGGRNFGRSEFYRKVDLVTSMIYSPLIAHTPTHF